MEKKKFGFIDFDNISSKSVVETKSAVVLQ